MTERLEALANKHTELKAELRSVEREVVSEMWIMGWSVEKICIEMGLPEWRVIRYIHEQIAFDKLPLN